MRQAHSAHQEELQHIVEAGRVGHAGLDNRGYLADITQRLAAEDALTRLHPPAVAPDCVDLAVVRQQAERLCQRPCRESIGRETRVNHCKSAGKIGVAQVWIELAQLHAREHTFIHDARVAQRTEVEILVIDTLLDAFSQHIKRAGKSLHLVVLHTSDENLLDVGFGGKRPFAQALRPRRNGTQVHQLQPFALYLFYNDAQDILLPLLILGEEYQTGGIFAFFRHGDARKQNEFVGNLQHDAGAIAVLTNFCAAVTHVLQNLKCIVYKLMGFSTVDVDYHPDSAAVMFPAAVVKSYLITVSHNGCKNIY